MKKILTTIFLVVVFQNAIAYPISPRSLRKMILESDVIIKGFIVAIEETKQN